jgi:hypothetical protein
MGAGSDAENSVYPCMRKTGENVVGIKEPIYENVCVSIHDFVPLLLTDQQKQNVSVCKGLQEGRERDPQLPT